MALRPQKESVCLNSPDCGIKKDLFANSAESGKDKVEEREESREKSREVM